MKVCDNRFMESKKFGPYKIKPKLANRQPLSVDGELELLRKKVRENIRKRDNEVKRAQLQSASL